MSKKMISQIFLEEKQNLDYDAQQKEKKTKEKSEKKLGQDKKQIMREIELKTEEKVRIILEKGQADDTNILQNILSAGAKEFTEKTGRHMSYSEMREMFG